MSGPGDLPIDAYVSKGGGVTYIYADGHTLTLQGDHPYRDNNPGNLSYAGRNCLTRAKSAGAIAVDPTAACPGPCSNSMSAHVVCFW